MVKVSRSMLKSIVKECLVELLAEGLSGGDTSSLNESLSLKENSDSLNKSLRNKEASSSNKVVNPKFKEKTKQIISSTTSDPIMASILEDTANTTLQEQNTADKPNKFTAKNIDIYSKAVEESDPMEMFEGSSSNWASLAFSDSKK
tara:strand:- start:157 stop:594 length:438 start_codon:yes stop_codon:yes gene_type:complete